METAVEARLRVEKEKEKKALEYELKRKRDDLEEKRKKREKELETNMTMRVGGWVQGISKHIQKAKHVINQVSQLKDLDLRKLYTNKFKSHLKAMEDSRIAFEDNVARKQKIGKARILEAEGQVNAFKTDLGAWNKIKNTYN